MALLSGKNNNKHNMLPGIKYIYAAEADPPY